MKLTLMIEGSVAAIAAVLAKLDNNVTVTTHPELNFAAPLSHAPLTPAAVETAFPTPAQQTADTVTVPVTSIPMPTSVPASADEDDNEPVDVGAPNVDSKGMPWDKRIHASSKATVSDGTWRMRRNVDKAIVDIVEAELKGTVSAQATTITPAQPMPAPAEMQMPVPTPISMQMPVATESAEFTPAQMPVVYGVQVHPDPAPVSAIAMDPNTPSPAVSFPDFMMKLSLNMAGDTPTITPDYLITVVQRVNTAFNVDFKAITDLGAHPDKLSWAVQLMTGEGRW